MKKNFVLLLALINLISINSVKSQIISIGHDANYVMYAVQNSINQSSTDNITFNVIYKNGSIYDVVQCYHNQYKIELRKITNYCRHFIMEGGNLLHILTEYGNVTYDELKSAYSNKHEGYLINNYYFEPNFDYYTILIPTENDLVQTDFRKVNLIEFPIDIQKIINERLIKINEINEQEIIIQQRKDEELNQRRSIVYDLKIEDLEAYENCVNQIKSGIKNYLQRFQKSQILIKEGKERFKNSYSAYFKIEYKSRSSSQYGNIISAGTINDFKITRELNLLSGTDENCFKFNNMCIDKIPILTKDNFYVTTETRFDSINIDYFQGRCIVKIKNGKMDFLKYEPEPDVCEIIEEKGKNQRNGNYLINYYYSNIMGDIEDKFEFEKLNVLDSFLLID